MEGRLLRPALLALTIAASLAMLSLATEAHAATTWLCKPGANPNPCFGSLQTTVIDPAGQSHVGCTPKSPLRRPADGGPRSGWPEPRREPGERAKAQDRLLLRLSDGQRRQG